MVEQESGNQPKMYNPKFIPLYPAMLKEGYSLVDAALYGFIDFFLSNNEKFYFSNEQIGEILGIGEWSISKSIKKLVDDGFINVDYVVKAGGGKIRFISKIADLGNTDVLTCEIHMSDLGNSQGIYNNIINNKINNNIIPSYQKYDLGEICRGFMASYPKQGNQEKCLEALGRLSEADMLHIERSAKILKWKVFYGIKERQFLKNPLAYIESYKYDAINDSIELRELFKKIRGIDVEEMSEDELKTWRLAVRDIGKEFIDSEWKKFRD